MAIALPAIVVATAVYAQSDQALARDRRNADICELHE